MTVDDLGSATVVHGHIHREYLASETEPDSRKRTTDIQVKDVPLQIATDFHLVSHYGLLLKIKSILQLAISTSYIEALQICYLNEALIS